LRRPLATFLSKLPEPQTVELIRKVTMDEITGNTVQGNYHV
jgi:hypothetical protein